MATLVVLLLRYSILSVVTLSDTAANIDGLTPTQITGLDAIGVTGIIASGAVILSVAEAMALETAGLAISDPTLSDTAVNIESLTATEILGLDAIGVTTIAVTNGSVSFSVAQAIALETEGLKVSAPTGDFVTLSDTAANIATLTAAQIAGLEAIGVTAIVATNASVSLSVAQTSAVTTAGLSVGAPANDTVTEHNADGSYNVHYYGDRHVPGRQLRLLRQRLYVIRLPRPLYVLRAGGNVLASESFATNGGYSITVGGVLTQQKTVNADGSYDIHYYGDRHVPGRLRTPPTTTPIRHPDSATSLRSTAPEATSWPRRASRPTAAIRSPSEGF